MTVRNLSAEETLKQCDTSSTRRRMLRTINHFATCEGRSVWQVLHGYIPQESSSSAMGQSSTPLQTKFVGMQEPSPQVKSMEGHGAKPTGCHRQKIQDPSDQRSRLVFCLAVAIQTFSINFSARFSASLEFRIVAYIYIIDRQNDSLSQYQTKCGKWLDHL